MSLRTSNTLGWRTVGRAHLATIVAAAAAAALVGLGIGTRRDATSSEFSGLADPLVGATSSSSLGASLESGLSGSVRELGDSSVSGLSVLSALGLADSGTSRIEDRPALLSDAPNMALYNSRPIRVARTMRMVVTAYSPDFRSCGASADGITASGYSVLTNGGCLVAADPHVLPLGSLVSVPGYDGGAVVPVLDTGGAIKGNRLDVLYATHEVAMRWGVQEVVVELWEYADGKPHGFRRLRRPSR